ncbi:Helix-turn-helix domain [Achromobacter sp. 2789STDY5608615]|uniref:helix-turn-helix domain-containing protein n=1 Tax=Achromobacter sp. 2789STDY5608615 TaxID=1806492 RepID=UPI0006C4C6C1|nr:helix-turn-helix transcriptional regulator [Achromobacter sp. 2789STDY5608615]CUK22110.1 Helix-turn-helix domain [Achromobacter sp. 2789STDY5608615]
MSIGNRLREERKRIGLDQGPFGQIGGVQTVAQSNYENGKRMPDAAYLEKVAAAGVDVLYVLTGTRSLSQADLFADLKRYGDAWETLEMALEAAGRELSPAKKRKAADALYQASKAQMSMDKDKLTELVLQLAA